MALVEKPLCRNRSALSTARFVNLHLVLLLSLSGTIKAAYSFIALACVLTRMTRVNPKQTLPEM